VPTTQQQCKLLFHSLQVGNAGGELLWVCGRASNTQSLIFIGRERSWRWNTEVLAFAISSVFHDL